MNHLARETYTKVNEWEDFPLPYCGHRWCENENCVNGSEMIWSGYIQFIEVLNKSKQPQGKCFPNPLIPAKLKLTEFITSKLNCFLRDFQTDQPMVPFICDVLKDLLMSMMKMFILSDRYKNTNAIVQTKHVLQEIIQWIIDITDTCFTDFFDKEELDTRHWKANIGTRHEKTIYKVKSMTEILTQTWLYNWIWVRQNSNWVLCCYPYTKQFWFFFWI